MPDTLIVTGAAGFIGSHLASALLDRGHRVVGIDNFDPFYARSIKQANLARITSRLETNQATVGSASASASFSLIEADIRDTERLKHIVDRHAPTAIFHLAALAGVRPSIADPARYVSVNLDGTTSVLEAARAAGCRHIIFASSSSVYGNNSKVPFAEDDPVDAPISPYAATKRAGELICHTYAHLFEMRIAAIRFFTVYGPSQRPDLAIASFIRKIAAGEEIPMFGDGTTSRDYTYIDDIIAGVLAAWDLVARQSTGSYFRIFNLGGSHPVTLKDMIEAISQVVGKPARIKPMPMQPGDVERTWANVRRSAEELHYEPHTEFAVGLRRQWQAMQVNAAASPRSVVSSAEA